MLGVLLRSSRCLIAAIIHLYFVGDRLEVETSFQVQRRAATTRSYVDSSVSEDTLGGLEGHGALDWPASLTIDKMRRK